MSSDFGSARRWAERFILDALREGSTAIDATLGNGQRPVMASHGGPFRALTKPTTARIALIYEKSEAILASCVSCTCILRSLTSM